MIEEENPPEPKVEHLPCGCITVKNPDGTNLYAPCVPCGLFRTAKALEKAAGWWGRRKALREASQSLAAVATTVQRETQKRGRQQAIVNEALAQEKKKRR